MRLLVDNSFFRTLRIWWAFVKIAMLRHLEFRIQLIGRASVEIIWIGITVLFFATIFRMNPKVQGWTFDEIMLFSANLIFVDALYMLFVYENMQKFGNVIRNGLFDSYLLRPVSSVLLGCFREMTPIAIVNLVTSITFFIWCALFSNLHLTPLQWLINFSYVLIGAYLLLVFSVIMTSISFWTTQSRSTTWLFFEFYRLGHRPESFYTGFIKRFVIAVFPAAFFISIPTQLALFKKTDTVWFFIPIAIAVVLTFVAKRCWNQGLARYEGALS